MDKLRPKQLSAQVWVLIGIMTISIIAGLVADQWLKRSPDMQSTIKWVDDWDYINYSKAIFNGIFLHTECDQAESDFYRTDEVPPLYPIILAAFYGVVGYDHLNLIIYFNLLLSIVTIYLIFIVGKRILPEWLALLPPLLWSVYINRLTLIGRALKEPLITIFILLIVYQLIRLKERYSLAGIIGLALTNVLFAHLDERYLYMPVLSLVFVLIILLSQAGWGKAMLRAGLYAGLALLLFLPWQIRNYHRYDRPVLITPRTTLLTDRILGYRNTEAVIADLTSRVSPGQLDSIYQGYIPAGVDTVTQRNIRRAAEAGLRPHYFSLPERIYYNTLGFWQIAAFRPFFTGSGYRFNPGFGLKWNLISIFQFGLFFLLALPAFYLGYKRRNLILIIFFSILSFNTIQHAVLGAGLIRYRAVMDPLVFIAAAYTLQSWWDSYRQFPG